MRLRTPAMMLYERFENIDTGDLTGSWYAMEFDVGGNRVEVVFVPVKPTDRICTAHIATTPINYDHPELQPKHCIEWHKDRSDSGYECQWVDVVRVPKEHDDE